MATPRFNSQQSKAVLDVSAFHSSSPSASQPNHHPMAKMARSPTVEASQTEARVAESVERIEDSYQDSLPMPPLPQHADNDDEDDLYSLSPKGRQSLDATMAKRKAQVQRVSQAARRMYVAFLTLRSKHRSLQQRPSTNSSTAAQLFRRARSMWLRATRSRWKFRIPSLQPMRTRNTILAG
jgi:hypothetical protein